MNVEEPAADARLPARVREVALELGADASVVPGDVRLRQTGRIKRILAGSDWMAFRARQTLSTRTCEFDWRARAGPLGLVTARDALRAGEGRFRVAVLRVFPIARGPISLELLRGQLLRYLAELPWAPDAILHNASLSWRSDGPQTLVVSATVGAASASVTFTLAAGSRIVSAFAPDRPRWDGQRFVPTPWMGHFSEYRRHAGRLLPFDAEVGWVLGGLENVYFQGRVERWDLAGR